MFNQNTRLYTLMMATSIYLACFKNCVAIHSNPAIHYSNQGKVHIFTGYKLQSNTGITITEYLVLAQSQACIGNPDSRVLREPIPS